MIGSSLTPNDKGVHDDKFCKKEWKEYIQILSTNADNLAKKLMNWIQELIKNFPEIIALCETKLNDDISNKAMPKNYTIIRKDRSRGRGGGGVRMMVHEDSNSKVWTDLNCVDVGYTEHLWCEITWKMAWIW